MLKKNRAASVIGLTAVVSLILAACAEGGTLQGEGTTPQQRAMDLFATKFEEAGLTLSHNAFGFGSSQTQFIAGTVAFVGFDSSLKEKDGKDQVTEVEKRCDGNDAWHLPTVIGPVAVIYNLEGTDVTLTPALVAEIFDGKITKWNDPKVAKANKDTKLPEKDIKVAYRSEESGTIDNFMKFLSVAAPDQWKHEASKSFPTATGQGVNSLAGIVDEVSNIDNAITYVETGFAKNKNLDIAKMDFGHGPVRLNNDTIGKALDSVTFKIEGHDMVVDTDTLFVMDKNGAYPLILTTHGIVCSACYDEETRDLVKNLLKVVLEEGQGPELEELGYTPIQGEPKDKLSAVVDTIE